MSVSVLPGETTDGSGTVCIHLFVQDDRGLIVEPHVMYPAVGNDGKKTGRLLAKAARGRIACSPKMNSLVVVKGGVVHVTLRTDVREAVTCLKCKQSQDFAHSNVHVSPTDSDQTVKET